jgi:hypothetical protein
MNKKIEKNQESWKEWHEMAPPLEHQIGFHNHLLNMRSYIQNACEYNWGTKFVTSSGRLAFELLTNSKCFP